MYVSESCNMATRAYHRKKFRSKNINIRIDSCHLTGHGKRSLSFLDDQVKHGTKLPLILYYILFDNSIIFKTRWRSIVCILFCSVRKVNGTFLILHMSNFSCAIFLRFPSSTCWNKLKKRLNGEGGFFFC